MINNDDLKESLDLKKRYIVVFNLKTHYPIEPTNKSSYVYFVHKNPKFPIKIKNVILWIRHQQLIIFGCNVVVALITLVTLKHESQTFGYDKNAIFCLTSKFHSILSSKVFPANCVRHYSLC